jgi:succinyl-CoA synthetase alpha subunit
VSIVVNEIRAGFYLDSVALMRLSRQARDLDGVVDAGLMIGTPANLQILRDAGLLSTAGERAGPGDLVIALRVRDDSAGTAALTALKSELDRPRRAAAKASGWAPRTLRGALAADPALDLALISVPGDFAVAEAWKALSRGLNVMIFSDNVSVEDEIALKAEGRTKGLFVMGPDCGTAIIGGVPLAFANAVPRGDIGIIGASGTGIQEVSCLVAQAGRGVSHAIGTGGRDLSGEVGAVTTLMAIEALAADPATTSLLLVSKPPERRVAERVLAALGASGKPAVVCFLGASGNVAVPKNCRLAATLEEAAALATGREITQPQTPGDRRPGKSIRGLFAGGTMCAEAQVVLHGRGLAVASNVPVPGAASEASATSSGHVLIDLGDDEFTRGRPHPMIEPSVRDAPLAAALADPSVGVVLLDLVLGYGGHLDPAAAIADVLATSTGSARPVIIASVTGTEQDPQVRSAQVAKLTAAGVIVAPSNAAAARLAAAVVA